MLKATSSIVNVSQITGVLPVVNGGTGVTTSTGTGSTVLSAAPTLTGNVTLSTGNLIVASGQGIDFSATPGTGTSELLNDYEEGTFTPVAQGTSTAGTATYTTQSGTYTKIGNRVFFELRILYSGGTGTGNMRVGGLPFTSKASLSGAVVNIYPENLAGTAGYIPTGSVTANSAHLNIDQVPVGGGGAAALAYDGAADISLSGSYIV